MVSIFVRGFLEDQDDWPFSSMFMLMPATSHSDRIVLIRNTSSDDTQEGFGIVTLKIQDHARTSHRYPACRPRTAATVRAADRLDRSMKCRD